MNDWIHQLDKLNQSHAGTCKPGRLTCSILVHEISNSAADAGTVRCDWNAMSNRSFWQWRSAPTEDVELDGQRCQTVWHYHSTEIEWQHQRLKNGSWHWSSDTACHRMAKNDDTVLITCDLIDTSTSIHMPRFRRWSAPKRSNDCDNWCSGWLVVYQRTSVFAAFNWRRFERIHSYQQHDRRDQYLRGHAVCPIIRYYNGRLLCRGLIDPSRTLLTTQSSAGASVWRRQISQGTSKLKVLTTRHMGWMYRWCWCMLTTINFSFLLSPLNSPLKFHTCKCKPQLILMSLSGCLPIFCHLIRPKRSFSSLVFLLNFPKSLIPVFACHLTTSLHQLAQHANLVSSLILHSLCPITFLQFLNLISYPSVTYAE